MREGGREGWEEGLNLLHGKYGYMGENDGLDELDTIARERRRK